MWCIAIAPINYSEKMQSLTCWTVGVCYIGIFLVLNLQPSQALPINNEAVKRERTERNLSEYILHLLGITPTTETRQPAPTEATPSEPEEGSVYGEVHTGSGNDVNSTEVVAEKEEEENSVWFDASMITDIDLGPLPISLTGVEYNFIRISSVIYRNDATSREFPDDNSPFRLSDGVFFAPASGLYHFAMVARVKMPIIFPTKNDTIGVAFCLNSDCNGQLNSTVMYTAVSGVSLSEHTTSVELSGNLRLQEYDSVKFFFYKSQSLILRLLKDTSISGAMIT